MTKLTDRQLDVFLRAYERQSDRVDNLYQVLDKLANKFSELSGDFGVMSHDLQSLREDEERHFDR